MDDMLKNQSENINENEWTFLLLMMLMEDIKQRNSQWKSFENELIYNNRFSVKHAVIDEIHECQESATKIIKEGTILYRARVFDKSNFDKLVKYYLKENGCSQKEIDNILTEWSDEAKLLSLLPEIYSDYDYTQTPELVKAQKKWKRNVKFKGWNAQDSSAPPPDYIGNGRANPDHIRYLYLSEDPTTPIYEVRPIIGQTVSVAKFKLKKDVKIYDLTLDIHDIIKDTVAEFPRLYNTIGAMFSHPYNGEVSKYLPTQYLAEEIKNMGFDGLRFRSSLNKNGINVVLFNPEICNATSSDLVDVKEIKLKLDKPMIYKIGTPTVKDELKDLEWVKKV